MIDFYTWTTPNGRKVSIMLEECGLPYRVKPVDLTRGEQFASEFVKVSANGRIPAIVDPDGPDGRLALFESGAILIYLAEKAGKFLAPKGNSRAKALEWLMFQMSGIGPMMGQANYFMNTAPEKIPYAIDRYISESARLLKVLDGRLGEERYLAGDYSIADMAAYPWVVLAFEPIRQAKPEIVGEGAHVARWLGDVGARPAVQAGMAVPG